MHVGLDSLDVNGILFLSHDYLLYHANTCDFNSIELRDTVQTDRQTDGQKARRIGRWIDQWRERKIKNIV